MLRRAQLALALILLLLLTPLAGASCGIECLTTLPQHHPMHAAMTQRPCVHASACCHRSGASVCSTTYAPDATAFLSTNAPASLDAIALAILSAQSLPLSLRSAAHRIDNSPPGQPPVSSPIPLRV